jgi:monomeric isocitrate dehydrogenase
MNGGDFFDTEQSVTMPKADDVSIVHTVGTTRALVTFM